MRYERVKRTLTPALALAALAIVLILLGVALAGPAHAASAPPTPGDAPVVLQEGAEVRFGEDVVVPAGTTAPQVVVFGGDILVDGAVNDVVIAFGGDIVINGTVGREIVAFGGDVTLGPRAIAGSDLSPDEASLVLFGGTLTQDPGAQVVGQANAFSGIGWSKALSWAAGLLFVNPFWGLSLVGWIVQTAFFLVLALVAAALMPRQLRSLQQHLGRKPWASLGWGSLIFFIIGPAVMVVLVISIIGLLLVLPYGLFVLLAYFFATMGVAAYLAQRVMLGFGGKENLMLAVTLGVVGTTVLSRIPVAGPLLVTAMMVFGAGAAALGIAEWRRVRRQQAAGQAVAAGASVTDVVATALTAPPEESPGTEAPAEPDETTSVTTVAVVDDAPAEPAESPGSVDETPLEAMGPSAEPQAIADPGPPADEKA